MCYCPSSYSSVWMNTRHLIGIFLMLWALPFRVRPSIHFALLLRCCCSQVIAVSREKLCTAKTQHYRTVCLALLTAKCSAVVCRIVVRSSVSFLDIASSLHSHSHAHSHRKSAKKNSFYVVVARSEWSNNWIANYWTIEILFGPFKRGKVQSEGSLVAISSQQKPVFDW